MRIDTYTEYMRHIALQYIPIRDILEIDVQDLREFEEMLRGARLNSLVFVLESYNRQSMPISIENHHDVISASFLILDKINAKKIVKLEDLVSSENAVMQLRYRMELDYAQNVDILDGLQLGSFRVDPSGIYANEWAGWRMEYSFSVKEEPKLNEANWGTYTPFKSLV